MYKGQSLASPTGPAPQLEIPRSRFAQGMARLDTYRGDLHLGRFSEGMEANPADPQRDHRGRFSEGLEVLAPDRPEKHIRRRFSEGN